MQFIQKATKPPAGGSKAGGEKMQDTTVVGMTGVVEIRPEVGKPYVIPLDNLQLAKAIINGVIDDLIKRKGDEGEPIEIAPEDAN